MAGSCVVVSVTGSSSDLTQGLADSAACWLTMNLRETSAQSPLTSHDARLRTNKDKE